MSLAADAGKAVATSFVIRCTGVSGAFGPATPVGSYLVSFDPDAVDPTLQFRGLARWSASLRDALRFPTEVAAHECIEAGLAGLFRVVILPLPARQPPVVNSDLVRRATGHVLTDAEREEAQAALDRLWLDGYL